ncbi:MAG: 50S ribosomal protein L25/general stress protein Ctc, partial [Rhodocyclaceae bacterium]|nr:50S ribosomal protein L25/general stress protein Ctc [Rhodocyclaceae bacterium]
VPPQMIEFDHNTLYQSLRKEAFHASVINMDIDGTQSMCLLRDVQMHAYKLLIKHVDFQRIDADHVIHQKVPLHFINAESAPGIKLQGGMVQHVFTEIDIKCLPKDLPEFIVVDLKALNAGDSIHLSQLMLPTGVEVVHHGEGDPVVAGVVIRGGGSLSDEAVVAEGAGETPAVAGKKPAAAPVKKVEKKGDKR